MNGDREFQFTDRNFNVLKELAAQFTGIALSDAKRNMVYSRLAKRVRALGLENFDDYCDLLRQGDSDEVGNFVNAITTNLTSFFRENHHFQYLSNTLLPHLKKEKSRERRLRVWSAGCSTGEEPYSLAITLGEFFKNERGWDVKILATDLDTNVLDKARRGVYAADQIKSIPASVVRRWFIKGTGANADAVKLRDAARQMITFKQLNLMEEWPMRGPFDFIFCRNVVIYFTKETQRVLFDRYANLLVEQGHLFIGHSETLYKVSNRFDSLGQTIYRKKS
ncbi:MAG TPA: protein-glutamate O-methyltransferase CheR [Gammaproteobacteria bacterium]|nr:protein-glutamate O-methyltransferase CheR [Gammaproteobacteria bacterium]